MRQRWILVSIGLLWARSLCAQIPPGDDPTLVQGLVTEFGVGNPLERVTVSLTPASPARFGNDDLRPDGVFRITLTRWSDRTGEDGRFELEDVDPGEYYLLAELAGYIRPDTTDPRGIRVSVPDDTLGALSLELVPGATIEGHVFDAKGEPLPGVQVSAKAWAYGPGGRVLEDVALRADTPRFRGTQRDPSVTGESGAYRLAGLMPGEYLVVARRPTRTKTSDLAEDVDVWAPVYFPSADRPEAAGPIRVDRGARVAGIDVSWREIPTVTVRGRIEGAPGTWELPSLLDQGFLDLRLSEENGETNAGLDLAVNAGGEFTILAVADRTYVLSTSVDGTNASLPYTARTELSVRDSDLDDVVVTLEPPVSFTGRITPAAPPPGDFRMSQLSVDIVDVEAATIGRVFVREDGTFQTGGTANGTYLVGLEGLPPGMYLESGRYGIHDPLSGAFRPGDDPGATLELRIGVSPGRVAGTVQPPRGVALPKVHVSLVPQGLFRERYDLYRNADADSEGRFRFENIAPGSYRVFAWNVRPDRYALMDQWFLLPFESQGTFVQVESAGSLEVEPTLIIR